MNYYYLTPEKKPAGPLALAEMCAMAERKEISPTVLIAKEGDAAWRPLAQIAAEQGQKLEIAGAPGACPSCGRVLQLHTDAGLPHNCPGCGRALRPQEGKETNLWHNFLLALRQYAKFSGRATRMEYWSFALFSTLVGFVLQLLMSVCEGISAITPEDSMGADIAIACFMLLLALVSLAFVLPSYAVSVRRLHDVGWSGKWILALVIGGVVAIICLISTLLTLNMEGETAGEILTPGSIALMIVAGAAYLEIIVITLIVLVLSFFDSQRGPNKYGPSRKYPLG